MYAIVCIAVYTARDAVGTRMAFCIVYLYVLLGSTSVSTQRFYPLHNNAAMRLIYRSVKNQLSQIRAAL
jgi:hypothetical protein